MNNTSDNKYITNKKYNMAIKKFFIIFKPKVNDRSEIFFHKLQIISINKSPELLALKCAQFRKRLSKLYTFKLRQYWTTLLNNTTNIELLNKQKTIDSIKIKDRVYQAKVKSLRVLSRQWKQKKSQNVYKSKYFTPKSQQTPKMVKEKVSQQFYITLRNILRNKYLHVFNVIKTTQAIKMRNSKTFYLANYLLSKKKYWLTFGFEKLKLNVLVNRQERNKDQIEQLDTRMVPVQDSQIQNLKQKQEKLQSALDTVAKQKENVISQVQKEVSQIEQTLQGKKNEIKLLTQKKLVLEFNREQNIQKSAKFQFSREEIFYFIYTNFLHNLKLWSEMQTLDQNNIFLNKALVLQWLQCPVVDFDLDKISLTQQSQLNEIIQSLSSLVEQYQRLRKNDPSIDMNDIFQNFFTSYSSNQCNNYEDLFTKIKFTSKMLDQAVNQNEGVMTHMLETIQRTYEKLQGQSLEILEY